MNVTTVWMFLFAAGTLFGAGQNTPSDPSVSEIAGIDLRFDSAKPTFGELEGPAFSVHADTGKQMADLGVWALDNAHAIIYRRSEENLDLFSKSMTFDMTNKAAQLAGGVRLTSGRLVVDVEDMSWDDTARIARSGSVATLNDGMNRITGSSIAIYPDADHLELGGGSATIQLAAAVEQKPSSDSEKPSRETEFESIKIIKHQGITANMAGQIREIKGPARLVIVGKDPDDTMNVDADAITFSYTKPEDTMPAEMLLKGRVKFDHSEGTFHADEATVELAAGKVRFRGNVTIDSDQIHGAKTSSLDMDLNTRELIMGPGEIESFNLAPAEKPAKKP